MNDQERNGHGSEITDVEDGGTNEDDVVPNDYAYLDELADPSPIDWPHQQQRNGHGSEITDVEDGGTKEDDVVPTDYANLDELADPSPIDWPHQQQREGYLEDRRSYNGDQQWRQRYESQRKGSEDKIEDNRVGNGGSASTAIEAASPPSSQSSPEVPQKENSSPLDHRQSQLTTQIYTISYLIFFSILGTLARLGLQALTFYPGAPVQTGVLWANFGGSLIMGFLSEDRALFYHEDWGVTYTKPSKRNDEEHGNLGEARPRKLSHTASEKKQYATLKKTIPLYIGLATGFCGSFTSFSSFIRDAFLALSNALPVPTFHTSSGTNSSSNLPRNEGYSFMAVLAVIIVTVAICLGALQTGAHLAIALERYIPSIPYIFARKFVDRTMVFVAWMSWLGVLFMAIWPPDRPGGPVGYPIWAQERWRGDALFALVFAPLGCLLRFYASLHLNGKLKSFPLGTFTVNVLGTVLEGMFYDLQHVPLAGRIGCQVLQGAMDGFCGCLTTVSTWVSELKALRLRHAYVYGLVSVGSGVGLMVVIMGSLQWTHGFIHPSCGS